MDKQTVKINVNGTDYEVLAGQNVLEACRSIGIEIPYFCYHPNLKVAGSCRMCLVRIGMPARDRQTGQLVKNADGTPKIAWPPKPSIACGTKVADGMHIVTDDESVESCRKGVIEFLLLNHPLDCPICDKAGECKLQEYAYRYGAGHSRYVENKNVKPKKVEVAGKIMLDAERCIQCSRCIRFSNEFIGRSIFGFVKRGSKTEISVYEGADNTSNYLLNAVDGCPVGALTEKAFRFQMRTWFLKVTDSICGESSAGANTRVWSRENKIYRVTPRTNPEVNEMWMSDSGRYVQSRYDEANRLACASVDASPCDTSYAINRCVEIMKLGGVAIVGNAWQSLEEMYVMKLLADVCGARVHFVSHLGEDDGKLVSADRTPNMRGAFATGLIGEYPKADLSDLAADMESGKVKVVLCFGENILELGISPKLLKKVNVLYCGILKNALSDEAKISVPLRSEFEKDGIWINRQFRAQKFARAVDGPEKSVDDLEFLLTLLREVAGDGFKLPGLSDIRREIGEKIPILKACCDLPPEGELIDGSAWSGIDFPEADAMHFNAGKLKGTKE